MSISPTTFVFTTPSLFDLSSSSSSSFPATVPPTTITTTTTTAMASFNPTSIIDSITSGIPTGFTTSSATSSSSSSSTTSSTTSPTSSSSSTSSTSTSTSTASSSTSTSSTTPSSSSSSSSVSVVTSTALITPTSSSRPTSTSIVPASTSSTKTSSSSSSTSASTSSTSSAGLLGNSSNGGSGGLSTGGTVAIAVVIPVVVVGLLIFLGIFLWRKRKQRNYAREERRKEVEEYGYNPNHDPTLPAVLGMAGSESPQMSEDTGYRGWGNNTNGGTMSARKPSTNLSSAVGGIGMAVSDDSRNRSPGSMPGTSPGEGVHPTDPLMARSNSGHGVLGGAAAAGAGAATATTSGADLNKSGINRGPSNASSTYSAAGHTDDSGEVLGNNHDTTYDSNYSQYTAYNGTSNGYGDALAAQPVIKDVSARRNTRIENAGYAPPGNSGIAQNF